MRGEQIFYVPPDFVEAVGWAAIAWAHLETALDVILAVGRSCTKALPPPEHNFASKVLALRVLADEQWLRNDWREQMLQLANSVLGLHGDLINSAHGTIYGRGIDNIGIELRALYELTHESPMLARMTKVKVNRLAAEIATETRKAVNLANAMVKAQSGEKDQLGR